VDSASEVIEADIVGPLCESGDTFARNRRIPVVRSGERLAIMSAGAYSSVMSSEYNSRPKCPEVLVQGEEFFVIRDAASFQQLIENERVPDFLGQVPPTTQSGERLNASAD
jgi:diaminopimelate decarboxylase